MEEKILTILQEVFDNKSIDTSCSQQNCEQWDSLHHLMLMSELEEAFNVELDPEEMAEMKSFSQIKAMLQSKV